MEGPTAEGVRVVGRRYQLIDKVGSGGMGTVWRAHDDLLDRTVAVKEVHFPAYLSATEKAELRARTMREARAAARLSHPNAVTVHDVIEEDGRPWIVMTLITAHSLSDVLALTGALPPQRVAEIGLAVLGALDAAHRAGILHRDVKPANVLLGDDRVVLTDFGVATLEGDPALTSTGLLMGSPAYIAPERALGEKAGPASDLWSLGATLHAAVAGRPPYDRSTPMATLAALATEDAPIPPSAGPLTAVLSGLLQRDPARRLDAPAASRLLREVLTGGPALHIAPPDPTRTDSWKSTSALAMPVHSQRDSRRRRRLPVVLWSLLVVAVVGALVAGALIATSSARRSTAEGSTTSSSPSPSPRVVRGAAVPVGYTRYTDPAGWSVAVPHAWVTGVVKSSDSHSFGPKDNRVKLVVVHTTDTSYDPLVVIQVKEKSAQAEHGSDYHRIFLGPVKHPDYTAAAWDYTVDLAGDRTVRYRTRGIKSGVRRYEVTLSAPAELWNDTVRYFKVATDTFEPAA